MNLVSPIYTKQTKKQTIETFYGLNKSETIKDGEFSEMENLCSDLFPYTYPRNPRNVVRELTKANGYYIYEGIHYYVDGTSFYVDGVSKGTVTDSEKQIIDFNDYILIFPDKKVYNIVADTFGDMATGTYPDDTDSVPDIDYVSTHMNRMFGVKDREIYSSKQGQYGTWADFSGLLTDSYATDIESGTFKGMATYQNHVVMFTEKDMYELYGYNPSNYQVQKTTMQGLVNNKSIVELDSRLYFANGKGIYVFSGGLPRIISKKLNIDEYSDVISGTDGKKLYCSIYDGSVWGLYVYDPEKDLWHYEDALQVNYFVRDINVLYGVSSNDVVQFDSGTETIEWSLTTNILLDETLRNKKINKINLLMDMDFGSSVRVYAIAEENETLIASFESKINKVVKLPVSLKSFEEYKLKIKGTGNVKIRAIQRIVVIK